MGVKTNQTSLLIGNCSGYRNPEHGINTSTEMHENSNNS